MVAPPEAVDVAVVPTLAPVVVAPADRPLASAELVFVRFVVVRSALEPALEVLVRFVPASLVLVVLELVVDVDERDEGPLEDAVPVPEPVPESGPVPDPDVGPVSVPDWVPELVLDLEPALDRERDSASVCVRARLLDALEDADAERVEPVELVVAVLEDVFELVSPADDDAFGREREAEPALEFGVSVPESSAPSFESPSSSSSSFSPSDLFQTSGDGMPLVRLLTYVVWPSRS